MGDLLIPTAHANEIFAAVQKCGFDPSQFEWRHQQSRISAGSLVSALFHQPSACFFVFEFDRSTAEHVAECTHGATAPLERTRSATWEQQREQVFAWLERLQRESAAKKLLERQSRRAPVIAAASESLAAHGLRNAAIGLALAMVLLIGLAPRLVKDILSTGAGLLHEISGGLIFLK